MTGPTGAEPATARTMASCSGIGQREVGARGLNNLPLQVTALILVTMAQTLVVVVRELDMSLGIVAAGQTVVMAVYAVGRRAKD